MDLAELGTHIGSVRNTAPAGTMDVVVIGAAGSGLKVLEILEAQAAAGDRTFRLVGFLDDDRALQGTSFFDYPVLGPTSRIGELAGGGRAGAICAIGDPVVRWRIVAAAGDTVVFPNVLHPTASVSPRASLGVGNVLSQHVVLQAGVEVGNFNSFNVAAVMGPVAKVHDFCTVNAQAMIASGAEAEDFAYIGMGAKIKQRTRVAKGTRVGANAFVSRPTAPWTTVFGVPARKIAERDDPTV